MQYVRRNTFITVERWVHSDFTLFDRLMAELLRKGHKFVAQPLQYRGLKVYLTLRFDSTKKARAAERWIDKKFEV